MQSSIFSEESTNNLSQRDEKDCTNGDSHVLHVIREIDTLLHAFRLLIRTCEKRTLHRETHALELSMELILRRRNYIVNVSTSLAGTNSLYDQFPCENCYVTYPTTFLISWLDYILNLTPGDCQQFSSHLCKRSCTYHFGTLSRSVDLVEGVLYPMGVPYVSGPSNSPPNVVGNFSTTHLFNELDELEYVAKSVRLVMKALRANHIDRIASVDICLVESVTNLLQSRQHFGFDMDCVHDLNVERFRAELCDTLESYENRLAAETFDIFNRDCHSVEEEHQMSDVEKNVSK